MNWNQPICEACWIDQRAVWVFDLNIGAERLTAVTMPVRLLEPEIERCAWCGAPTIFGAYVRTDPTTVPYPAPDDLPEGGATQPMKGTHDGNTDESPADAGRDASGKPGTTGA